MLKRLNRLNSKRDFERLGKSGIFFQSKTFGLKIFDRKDPEDSKFGFIISTKVSKKATVRNRTRRVFSEVIRLLILKIKKGLDLSFLIKPVAIGIKYEDLKLEIMTLLKQKNLLTE